MYNPPEDVVVNSSLNAFCVEMSCYNNNNSAFISSQCDNSYCETETVVPTVPDIDNRHWFFDYALYAGGAIHLLMSLAMVISYFLINASNFVLPDFVYQYMYVNLKLFQS